MKKLITAFMFLLPILVFAQKPEKHFFYIGGGYMSSLYIKEAVFKSITSNTDSRKHTCLILNAGYQQLLSKEWRAGTSFSYEHFGLEDRSVEYSVLSYSFRCDRLWKETKKTILYSGLSAGVRTLKKIENEGAVIRQVAPCYHFYLAGLDYKINNFLLDLNLGIGVSGILGFSAKYRFR
jgi:hypothetical protein